MSDKMDLANEFDRLGLPVDEQHDADRMRDTIRALVAECRTLRRHVTLWRAEAVAHAESDRAEAECANSGEEHRIKEADEAAAAYQAARAAREKGGLR